MLLAFGHVFLNRPGRAVAYLGRASYVLYIIHLPIVVTIGYYVVKWNAGVGLKYAAIVSPLLRRLGSFTICSSGG